jgi:sodium-dependent dicarboxylate transporter 2/3/5
MAVGIPMVIVLVPIAWWVLLRVYPPEMTTIAAMTDVAGLQADLGPLRGPERRVLGILGLMLLLWILSTWFRQLDTVLVAVLGAALMFAPGMDIFGWREVQASTGWDVLLVIGGVTSLGAASTKTGLATWLVEATLGGMPQGHIGWMIAGISTFTILIHLGLTIGPVIVAVLIPPVAILAKTAGVHPALYALPVIFSASCAFLLPLDAVTLVTYSRGYYRMGDMLKPGLVISVLWVVLLTGLLLLLGPVFGWR